MGDAYKVRIDFENELFFIKNRWFADPFYLLLKLFRDKFAELGPSADGEFNRINKILHSAGIKIPISKKDYDFLIDYDVKNQTILDILEGQLGAKNGAFVVPSKEYANNMFRNASVDLERMTGGLFVYEGREARAYVDIYDRLTGFEVILDNSTIFVPVKISEISRSAFNEHNLRNIKPNSVVKILEITDTSPIEDGVVFAPSDSFGCLPNVAKYFSAFEIYSNDDFFIMNIVKELYGYNSDFSILVNDESAIKYISNMAVGLYTKEKSSAIPQLVDIARMVAKMNHINRAMFIDYITTDIPEDVMELLKPHINGGNDNVYERLYEFVVNGNIEFCARLVSITGDSSQIRFYNKRMMYFKDFTLDRGSVSNELIPELGGIRKIAEQCDISQSDIPSGFSSVESFIIHTTLRIVQGEFGRLPVFDRFYGDGIHKIGEKIIFNSKHDVYGLGGRRSYGGGLFKNADIDTSIPKNKPTKAHAEGYILKLKEYISGFIPSSGDRDLLFSILLASSIAMPVFKKANKPTLCVYGGGRYAEEGFKKRVFVDAFRASKVVSTDNELVIRNLVDGGTVPIVVPLRREIESSVISLAKERYGTETIVRARGFLMFSKYSNTSPFVMISDEPVIIEESIVFNFPFKTTVEAGVYLKNVDDLSGGIIGGIIRNTSHISKLEQNFIKKALSKLENKKQTHKSPYVDFFEKVLAGMCIAEAFGVMSGWEFHDAMHDVYFNDKYIRLNIDIKKIILDLYDNGVKVEDKLYEESMRGDIDGHITLVDKFINIINLKKNVPPENFLVIFSRREMYKAIKDDLNLSFLEFNKMLDNSKSSINWDNAIKNYRKIDDPSITPLAEFKKKWDKTKEDFGAIRLPMGKYGNI
jgi:hypothetical protein